MFDEKVEKFNLDENFYPSLPSDPETFHSFASVDQLTDIEA